MLSENKIFWAIIVGACIIGGALYLGEQKPQQAVLPIPIKPSLEKQPQISQQAKTSTNAVQANSSAAGSCGAADKTIVTKVIDGDTVVVEGGWHVRLLGMDADEKGYPCYDAAKTRLENLVLAKQVVLEKDVSDVDQYGRCLRYIFLGSTNIDVQLVQEGLAVARFYEPDVKYRSEIANAEGYAQQNKIGCKWSGANQTVGN